MSAYKHAFYMCSQHWIYSSV